MFSGDGSWNGSDIPLLVLTGGFLVLVVFLFPGAKWLRILLGVPFLFFYPGYAVLLSLFPRKNDLGDVERIALSMGVSLAIVPLIALVLNYSFGIRLFPVVGSVYSIVVIFSLVGYYRRKKISSEKRYCPSLRLEAFGWSEKDSTTKLLAITFLFVLLSGGLVGAYFLPAKRSGFSEFYITGERGKLRGYPTNLTVGETSNVSVGIVNHEGKRVSYRVVLVLGGEKIKEIKGISIKDGGELKKKVSFTPHQVGNNLKLKLLLYKEGDKSFSRRLRLWLNVTRK